MLYVKVYWLRLLNRSSSADLLHCRHCRGGGDGGCRGHGGRSAPASSAAAAAAAVPLQNSQVDFVQSG